MNYHNLPNIISVLRIALAVPVVWCLVSERYGFALLLFGVGGVSDALDGFLAKHYGWTSRLGSILDPLADKILLVSAYLVLGWQGELPLWLVAAVIGRDMVIVSGALGYHALIGRVEMLPSLISKINTTLQIAVVLVVMFSLSLVALPPIVIQSLFYLALGTTVISGLDYVWTWGVLALRARRQDSGKHEKGGY